MNDDLSSSYMTLGDWKESYEPLRLTLLFSETKVLEPRNENLGQKLDMACAI